MRLLRALRESEDDGRGETLKDGDSDGEIDSLAETDDVDNVLIVTVLAGEREAVRSAVGDGEGIGDRDSDAAADSDNDDFGEDDGETDPDDVLLKFDDAELDVDSPADRLGVSTVLGDCE